MISPVPVERVKELRDRIAGLHGTPSKDAIAGSITCGTRAELLEAIDDYLTLRAAGEWQPWKPGDAMPARGRYPVLRNDADGGNVPYPALSYCDGDAWEPIDFRWPVIAYLPRHLPPGPMDRDRT